MISARVKSDVADARAKGNVGGRTSLTIKDIHQYLIDTHKLFESGAISKTNYAKICGVSRPTLNKYLKVILEG